MAILTLKTSDKQHMITITLDNGEFISHYTRYNLHPRTGEIMSANTSATFSPQNNMISAFKQAIDYATRVQYCKVADFGTRAIELFNVDYQLHILNCNVYVEFNATIASDKLEREIVKTHYELERTSATYKQRHIDNHKLYRAIALECK